MIFRSGALDGVTGVMGVARPPAGGGRREFEAIGVRGFFDGGWCIRTISIFGLSFPVCRTTDG